MNEAHELAVESCPVCHTEMFVGYQPWHYYCGLCAYEKANLSPCINTSDAHELIDERARESGLRGLRIQNFLTLVAQIKSLRNSGGRLLEIGCAHGWFLEASQGDFDVFGLEPDEQVYNSTSKRGLPVRLGYFPEALESDEKLDVMVFNDVIEHIPGISKVLEECHRSLNNGGLLVLNLPNSGGVFYRLSKVLFRFGFPRFFERLWQEGLPSPHLHYFNLMNLSAILLENGFEVIKNGRLSTLGLKGLYTRISYTGNHGAIASTLIWVCLVLSLPILRFLPSDIMFVIASKKV